MRIDSITLSFVRLDCFSFFAVQSCAWLQLYSKAMFEILSRLVKHPELRIVVLGERMLLQEDMSTWSVPPLAITRVHSLALSLFL